MAKLICTWRKPEPLEGAETINLADFEYDIHAKVYEIASWRMAPAAFDFPPYPTDDDTVDEPIVVNNPVCDTHTTEK